MEKFVENLLEAEKTIHAADHMVYVTFPLIKDKRLLLKVIQEIKKATALCITAILQYEYVFKRVTLYKNPVSNLKTFVEKCSSRYKINHEQIKTMMELFEVVERHKQSPFEFVKEDKVIILSNELKPTTLTLEKIKEFLIVTKNIIRNARETFEQNSPSI